MEAPKFPLAGPGYVILNLVRVMNIISLLVVIAANIILLIKIVLVTNFFFFEAVTHVASASVCCTSFCNSTDINIYPTLTCHP